MSRVFFCDFNTSYVTVQRLISLIIDKYIEFQYILCYGSTRMRIFLNYLSTISIHPMLRFNPYREQLQKKHGNFNTSYVTVQPLVLCDLYFSSYLNSIEIATFVIDFSNEDQVFYQRKKCSKTIEIPTCTQTPTDS